MNPKAREVALALIRAVISGRKIRVRPRASVISVIKKESPELYKTLMKDYVILCRYNWYTHTEEIDKKFEGELGFSWFAR